ncbi:hypothetical protein DCAR_0417253 [Daucus carota subsp. sativus]|uniref:Uncharacterized protein n=1 Tax=Daucus carota subsp. sativus TaxID=79200 RepID=A0A162ACN6_DAUCS|nr:PREDICTED: uncharacterized protein LOC108216328 [Daucus carota subsp. sativus]WOG97912.1 hypothetical protein DCAR_0417253 [Daucus carota subsp. sativus]
MASACINNISLSPEKFLDCPATFPTYGWLSPKMSFGRDEEVSKPTVKPRPQSPEKIVDDSEVEADRDDTGDFEFRLDFPVTMLPADELFSDGKLMPLQFRPAEVSSEATLPDTPKVHRSCEIAGMDPYLFSPKAPRCSSRWKELLGLKRLYQNNNAKLESPKTSLSSNTNTGISNGTGSGAAKSLKHFLHRNTKSTPASATDSSLSLPLLRDTDNESISISSRLSLSSSSSGHDHDDLPRLSLDLEKPHSSNLTHKHHQNPPRIRLVKHRTVSTEGKISKSPIRRQADSNAAATTRGGVSLDSPRMNSSGKIVFQSLERSSSSPSSFNGGPRSKHRGVERSYSANVRVTPVLNVPVCSLRGSSKSGGVFGFPLFSAPPHKRDNGSSTNGSRNHQQQSSSKNKTDRSS